MVVDSPNLGASALKIMKEIGVYDDILACTPVPGECNVKGFRYVLGSEGHEEIYMVSVIVVSISERLAKWRT